MKINIKTNSVVLLLLITITLQTPSIYQRVRYDSFTKYRNSDNGESYHSFTMSASTSPLDEVETSSYIFIVKRNDENAPADEYIYFNSDSSTFSKYTQFLPNMNSVVQTETSYVIWDITKDCALAGKTNNLATLSYKLKYYTCETDMMTFYNSLTETNKAVNYGSPFTLSNISLKTGSLFLDKANLLSVLNGTASTGLNDVFCQK